MRLSRLVLLALFVAACGEATTRDDAGGPSDAGADAAANACAYVDTIDRSCSSDADCHVGLHQTDCCGNAVMIGFRASEQATYASSESACMASYPGCGCPAMLPTTDSGETVTDTSAVQVACVVTTGAAQACRTYVTMRPVGL